MKFNFAYRPRTYFGPVDLGTHLISTIKGEWRRNTVEKLFAEGDLQEVDEDIARSSLPDDVRVATGRIHPCFMGGEYLPDLLANEVEIARISLNSTTADQISVRARRGKSCVYYRIVDEYEDKSLPPPYECHPKTSREPLSFSRLINLIESACPDGAAISHLVGNLEWSAPNDLIGFVRVSSAFYPELEAYYDERIDEVFKKLETTGEQELEEEVAS